MSGLKIGDSAEVVEIIGVGNFDSIFRKGDWGISRERHEDGSVFSAIIGIQGSPWYVGPPVKVRVVGRLRVTKVK